MMQCDDAHPTSSSLLISNYFPLLSLCLLGCFVAQALAWYCSFSKTYGWEQPLLAGLHLVLVSQVVSGRRGAY